MKFRERVRNVIVLPVDLANPVHRPTFKPQIHLVRDGGFGTASGYPMSERIEWIT
ncbi:MAG: hypothetical protein WCE35_17110 [Bradyrhizobium sp.]